MVGDHPENKISYRQKGTKFTGSLVKGSTSAAYLKDG